MSGTFIKLKVESGKDFFHVYDRTGLFTKKNTSGWGGKYKLSDVSKSTLNVYFPDKSMRLLDVLSVLPNSECKGLEVLPADLGVGSYPPGIYRFELVVTLFNGQILSASCYIFFFEPLECCIKKKKMKTDLNDASSETAKKVLELEALLKNAKWCACKGNMDCAQKIADYIWTNCGCCC